MGNSSNNNNNNNNLFVMGNNNNNNNTNNGSGSFKKPNPSNNSSSKSDFSLISSNNSTSTTTTTTTTTSSSSSSGAGFQVGYKEVIDISLGPISPSMIPDIDFSPTGIDIRWIHSPNSPGTILNNTWKSIKREDSLEHVNSVTSPNSLLERNQDISQFTNSATTSAVGASSSSTSTSKSAVPPFVTLPPNSTLQIVTYSPDVAPAATSTKVIAVVEKIDQTDSSRKQFNAIFEGIEVPAVVIFYYLLLFHH